MKIAALQSDIIFEDKLYNLKRADEFICRALSLGADLILFPEMSFTGFSMNVLKTGETDEYTIREMKRRARSSNIAIGFGYVRLREGKGENHYCIADKNGDLVSDYIKIHSFTIGGECEDFRSGKELPPVVRLCGLNIRTFICYDLRFPEIFRTSADETDIFVVAANWPKSRREHWKTLLSARAIENQAYVIGINCVGNQDNLIYSGDSMIIDPLGNVLSKAVPEREEMLVCDISKAAGTFRKEFPALESRKKELYKKLYC